MWHWPHYVVLFWQILASCLTLFGYWVAEDQHGRPKYSWSGLILAVIVYVSFVMLFNWVLAEGGFWP